MAMFLGLHSRLIHFVSIWSCSSEGLSSVTFWASFSATRIPTPPPLLFILGLWIHLYPLIDICSPLLSCVSVISAMDIFSVLRAASRLLILPLIPLTLMVAMVISLFFLIRGRRFLLCVVVLLFWSSLWLVGLLSLASVWITLRVMVASFLSFCGVSTWELVMVWSVVVPGLLGCPLSVDDGAGCPLGVAELIGCLVAGLVGCLVAGSVGCLVLAGMVGCLMAGLVGCLMAGLVDCLMAGLVGCLMAGLVGCLVAGLVGCLMAGLVGCLMAGLVGCLVAGLVGCLVAGMVGCLMAGLVGCLVAGLVGCLVAGLVGCLMAGLVGCLMAGLVGCLVAGLVGCFMAGLVGCLIMTGLVGCLFLAGLVDCLLAGLVGCLATGFARCLLRAAVVSIRKVVVFPKETFFFGRCRHFISFYLRPVL